MRELESYTCQCHLPEELYSTLSNFLRKTTLTTVFVAVAGVRYYTVQRDLGNLERFVPRKPGESRYWRSGLGGRSDSIKKYACSESIALQVAGGLFNDCATAVASCYDCCEKYRTGFYFVKRFAQQKRCVANCRGNEPNLSFAARWACHGSPKKDTRCGIEGENWSGCGKLFVAMAESPDPYRGPSVWVSTLEVWIQNGCPTGIPCVAAMLILENDILVLVNYLRSKSAHKREILVCIERFQLTAPIF